MGGNNACSLQAWPIDSPALFFVGDPVVPGDSGTSRWEDWSPSDYVEQRPLLPHHTHTHRDVSRLRNKRLLFQPLRFGDWLLQKLVVTEISESGQVLLLGQGK